MQSASTLTASGRGIRITHKKLTDFSVSEIRDLLAQYQWIDFKKHPISSKEAVAFMSEFGELTRNDRRQDALLKIDGSQKDEVLLGEGFMPLHRDGAFMGNSIEMVGIFCESFQNVVGGRTFISDIESAIREVPSDLIELIRERGCEGRPVDKYYTASKEVWHPLPGFIEVLGKSFLNIGFPYLDGEKPSWLVRIPGLSEERNNEVFRLLRDIMMDEKYCYYHEWEQPGDLLLFDNLRTLHGREAFKGQRSLANIQVLQKRA